MSYHPALRRDVSYGRAAYSPWKTDPYLIDGWPAAWGAQSVGRNAGDPVVPCADCVAEAGPLLFPTVGGKIREGDLRYHDGTHRCAAHARVYCQARYTACPLIPPEAP